MNGFWHQTNVNDTCNTFNKATDGSVFHPEIQKNEILQNFNIFIGFYTTNPKRWGGTGRPSSALPDTRYQY